MDYGIRPGTYVLKSPSEFNAHLGMKITEKDRETWLKPGSITDQMCDVR